MRALVIRLVALTAACSVIETRLVGVGLWVGSVEVPPTIPPVLIDRSYIYDGVYAIEEWLSLGSLRVHLDPECAGRPAHGRR